MAYSLLSFLVFSMLSLVANTNAQHNVTVNNTSPLITYGGNAGDASICRINPDGTLVPGKPGCYNVQPDCTAGISMGQGGSGTASFSFKGSAIYINSVLDSLSPIFTVTLDGQSSDVDGVRGSAAFSCFPLFSQTGLDPNVEHQIKLSVKGPSPNRNLSIQNSENFYVFSLVSFVYTAVSDSNTTSPTSAGNTSNAAGSTNTNTGVTNGSTHTTTNGGSGPTTSGAAPTSSSSSAVEMRHVPQFMLAVAALLAGLAVIW